MPEVPVWVNCRCCGAVWNSSMPGIQPVADGWVCEDANECVARAMQQEETGA